MTSRTSPAGWLARETAISAVINAAISAGFFFAMFGLGAPIAVWGMGGFVFDFMPQSLAVAFFASLVPSLLVGKAVAAGMTTFASDVPAFTPLFLRSLRRGLVALLIGGGAWAAIFWVFEMHHLPSVSGLWVKVIYGALLGAAVTYRTLQGLRNQDESLA